MSEVRCYRGWVHPLLTLCCDFTCCSLLLDQFTCLLLNSFAFCSIGVHRRDAADCRICNSIKKKPSDDVLVRNISSAGMEVRRKMRNYPGLVEALLLVIEIVVGKKDVDGKVSSSRVNVVTAQYT